MEAHFTFWFFQTIVNAENIALFANKDRNTLNEITFHPSFSYKSFKRKTRKTLTIYGLTLHLAKVFVEQVIPRRPSQ